MSLVAYESSGDEGSESDENSGVSEARPEVRPSRSNLAPQQDWQKTNETAETAAHLSVNEPINDITDKDEVSGQDFDIDDDDWDMEKSGKLSSVKENSKSIFSILPPPSQKTEKLSLEMEDDISDVAKLKTHFQLLEKEIDSSKANENTVEKTDEKFVSSKRSMKLVLPKPKISGKSTSKQTMKITLPDVGSDSDEESNENHKKVKSQGKKGSGLLGCLPKPKNSVRTQVVNINKPSEKRPNKIMVPYTLSKKKEEKKSKISKDKDSGSESDDEVSSSFFSLDDSAMDSEGVDNAEISKNVSNALESAPKSKLPLKTPIVLETNTNPQSSNTSSVFNLNSQQNTHFGDNKQKTTLHSSAGLTNLASGSAASHKTQDITERVPLITSKNTSSSVTGPYNRESVTGPYITDQGIAAHGSSSIAASFSTDSGTGPYSRGQKYGGSSVTGPNGSKSSTGPYSTQQTTWSYTEESVTGPYVSGSSNTGQYGSGYDPGTYGENAVTGPYGEDSVTGPYGASYGTNMNQQSSVGAHHTAQPYNDAYGGSAYLNPAPSGHYSQYQESNQQESGENHLDVEQLKRLQGKRERRLQEVDFIEIKGENTQMSSLDYLRNASEETTHTSKKLKSDNVSSQQKRKHQITYLAFQAKEREQELRKSWSAGQHRKRLSQQKYGF